MILREVTHFYRPKLATMNRNEKNRKGDQMAESPKLRKF